MAEGKAPGNRWVKYTGTAHVREISTADWARAGIDALKDQAHYDPRLGSQVRLEDAEEAARLAPTVRWDAANGHVVNADQLSFLSEQEFHRCIASDPYFQVLDSEQDIPEQV